MTKYLSLFVFALVGACNTSMNNYVPDGIFISNYENEFAYTEDTLNLKRINDEDFYRIERHSGVLKQLDGKIFPKEILFETWNVEYNNYKKAFNVLKSGKTLIWNESEQTLILGNRKYKRL